jgi:FAD/FMN-containing dehydrogenase
LSVVTSWGRLSADDHRVVPLESPPRVVPALLASPRPGIAFGMGRSYGDACLNPGGTVWTTRRLDRFVAFDEETGRLRCEAGVLLRDIRLLAAPRGWMLPVVPGTELVTVGGAIANDVHGKNHHACGTFGHHVVSLRLARTDGTMITCGPERDADWFAATLGGVGLTGVIVEAELQLRRVAGQWLDVETVPFAGLDEFLALADASEAGWESTVAWVDCLSGALSRGIFMRANPAAASAREAAEARRLAMPVAPPVSLVNGLSLRPLNALYFGLKALGPRRALRHHAAFHHPLDGIADWNRMYGPRGFFQHQSVVPRAEGREALAEMLALIARAGEGSFLAVLKTFGARESLGMLSFPRPGITLALDFPNGGDRTRRLLGELDGVVRAAGGRIYLAKDACMSRESFEQGYPRHEAFRRFRDPGIGSGLSRRLMGG